MPYKLTISKTVSYSEMPQTNPLRWKVLAYTGDQITDYTGWIACKDFFNDSVAFFKEGTKFSVYRYSNDIPHYDEGVYILLKHLKERGIFKHNLGVINFRIANDLGEDACIQEVYDVEGVPNDGIVLLLPMKLWDSTYIISMVSMAIRCANYGVQFDTWEEFWMPKSPAVQIDGAFNDDGLRVALKYGFKLPEAFKGYWWYAGEKYNSKTMPKQTGGIIHDNGVCGWAQWIK